LHREPLLVRITVTWLGLAIAELLPAMGTGLPMGDPSSRRAFANMMFRPDILPLFYTRFWNCFAFKEIKHLLIFFFMLVLVLMFKALTPVIATFLSWMKWCL